MPPAMGAAILAATNQEAIVGIGEFGGSAGDRPARSITPKHALLGYPIVGGQYTAYEERTAIPQPDRSWAMANSQDAQEQQTTTPPSTMTKDLSTIGAQAIGAPPPHQSTPMWSRLQLRRQQPAYAHGIWLGEQPIPCKLVNDTLNNNEIGKKHQPVFLPLTMLTS
jgi:hypothetical protein